MSNNGPATGNHEVERRSKPRIDEHFPAKVRVVDTAGKTFKAETVIDNLSAGGVYLRLARPVSPGADLFVIIRLSTSLSRHVRSPRVAARGKVLRSEPRPDGEFGLAVTFTRLRFIENI